MAGTAMNTDTRNFFFKAALLLVLLIGLYLRVSAVLNTVIDTPVRADARLYYLYGLNLKDHHTFSRSLPGDQVLPDAFVPPVYPAAITPFLELPPTDRMLVNIGLFQALLGTVTVLFTFFLFQALASRVLGLAAAVLTAISPHLISMTVYMLTETLFTFLMMGSLLALVYALTRNNATWAMSGGVLLGLAALTRSTLEYFPLFILLAGGALALSHRLEREQFRRLLQFAGTAMLLILAWKIRNLIATGSMSDPTLAISTLHHGMYPDFMFEGRPESRGIPYRFDPRTAEITASLGSILHEIGARFHAAPWQYLGWYLFGKPASLLSWNIVAGWGDIFVYAPLASPYFFSWPFQLTRSVMLHAHIVLMVLGSLATLLVLLRPQFLKLSGVRAVSAGMVASLVVYFILLHMVGAPFPRYGIPLRPVMYGMAIMMLWTAIARLYGLRSGTV